MEFKWKVHLVHGSSTSHILSITFVPHSLHTYLTKNIYFQWICQSKQMILIIWKINKTNCCNSVKNIFILGFHFERLAVSRLLNYLDFIGEDSAVPIQWKRDSWTAAHRNSITDRFAAWWRSHTTQRVTIRHYYASLELILSNHSFFVPIVCLAVCVWLGFGITIAFLVDHLLISICVFK